MTVETFLITWIPILVSTSALCFSIFMGLKGSRKTNESEIAERITRETRTDMKLDEIGNDTKEIKETVKNIQNDIKDHEGRIVKLEASYKAMHKRLDEMCRTSKSKEVEDHE